MAISSKVLQTPVVGLPNVLCLFHVLSFSEPCTARAAEHPLARRSPPLTSPHPPVSEQTAKPCKRKRSCAWKFACMTPLLQVNLCSATQLGLQDRQQPHCSLIAATAAAVAGVQHHDSKSHPRGHQRQTGCTEAVVWLCIVTCLMC